MICHLYLPGEEQTAKVNDSSLIIRFGHIGFDFERDLNKIPEI